MGRQDLGLPNEDEVWLADCSEGRDLAGSLPRSARTYGGSPLSSTTGGDGPDEYVSAAFCPGLRPPTSANVGSWTEFPSTLYHRA